MQQPYRVLGNEVDDDTPTLRMMRFARRADVPTVIIRRAPRRGSSAWPVVGVAVVLVLVAFVGAVSAHLALVALG